MARVVDYEEDIYGFSHVIGSSSFVPLKASQLFKGADNNNYDYNYDNDRDGDANKNKQPKGT